MNPDRHIRARIFNAFPITEPTFATLLGLLRIRTDEGVPTAAVTCGDPSELLLNPRFVAERCPDDPSLVTLVLHELYHVALGHTRLFTRATPAHNLAFDAVINALLSRLYPDPPRTALLRRSYSPDRLPEALLRPPDGWGTPAGPRWTLPGEWGALHRALYSDASIPYSDLFRRLADGLSSACRDGVPLLLGDHDPGRAEALDPDSDLADAVGRVIADWPMVERLGGRDDGGETTDRRLGAVPAGRRLRAVFARAFDWTSGAPDRPGRGRPAPLPTSAALPWRTSSDRRAAVAAAAGTEPLLHAATLHRLVPQHHGPVHVYLDVSGSMDAVLPWLHAAVRAHADRLHPQLHAFSSEIHDVPVARLRHRVVSTTGGTALRSVTAHLVRHRVRNAVIVTDGDVGEPPPDHLRRLPRDRRLAVCLTADGDPGFAARLGARVFRLPDIGGRP